MCYKVREIAASMHRKEHVPNIGQRTFLVTSTPIARVFSYDAKFSLSNVGCMFSPVHWWTILPVVNLVWMRLPIATQVPKLWAMSSSFDIYRNIYQVFDSPLKWRRRTLSNVAYSRTCTHIFQSCNNLKCLRLDPLPNFSFCKDFSLLSSLVFSLKYKADVWLYMVTCYLFIKKAKISNTQCISNKIKYKILNFSNSLEDNDLCSFICICPSSFPSST